MHISKSTESETLKKKASTGNGSEGPSKRSVLIIDDHLVVRQGLKLLIDREEDLRACGEAGDGCQGLDAIGVLKPDIVLVDISMPGMNGIEFIKNAKACHPKLPIVVFSMHDESLYAERVLRAGALGYVMKKADSEEILMALRKALRGEIYTSGAVSGTLLQQFIGRHQPKQGPAVSRLSDRELEVFEMIGHGKTTAKSPAH